MFSTEYITVSMNFIVFDCCYLIFITGKPLDHYINKASKKSFFGNKIKQNYILAFLPKNIFWETCNLSVFIQNVCR